MSDYTKNYDWIMQTFKSVMEKQADLGKTLREAGPIDEKTSQLVQLGAAAAMRSEGSVHSHVKRAMKAGAAPEEIYHTIILLISTIGFPATAAALSWARDIVED
jgi:AhpD family alkylhydroperoxidase